MDKILTKNHLLLSIILLGVFITGLCSAAEASQVPDELSEELPKLTEKEMKIQQELFDLSRKLDRLYEEVEALEEQVSEKQLGLIEKEKALEEQTDSFHQARDNMGNILRSLQRMGPLSYLEVLLEAENFSDFINRISIVRTFITEAQSSLRHMIDEKAKLDKQREAIQAEIDSIQELEDALKIQINNIEQQYAQQEQLLEEVQEDRALFEARKEQLDSLWKYEIQPFLADTFSRLEELVSEREFDEKNITLSGSLFNMTAQIPEKKFLNIIEEDPELERLTLSFYEEEVALSVPDKNLTLSGTFEVRENTKIELLITEGHFMNIRLPTDSIEELNTQRNLKLNFDRLLGGYSINSIAIKDGLLELDLQFRLF